MYRHPLVAAIAHLSAISSPPFTCTVASYSMLLMLPHDSGIRLIATFALALAALVAVDQGLTPIAFRTWVVPEPPMLSEYADVQDAWIGMPAPKALGGETFPLAVVVHVDCLGCRFGGDRQVTACFSRPDLLNVVLAPDKKEYERMQALIPSSKVMYVAPEEAKSFGAIFGPRLYKYDHNRRLSWMQAAPGPMEEVLNGQF
jgi:hypothetical protein